jgi:hypothetical protein
MSTELLEAVVEKQIMIAVAALSITGVTVQGFWNPAEAGNAKSSNAAPVANIFVAVAPRSYGSYGNKTCRFVATVKASMLPSNDPSGATLAPVFKAVMDLCMAWKDDASEARTDISKANEFQCDGVTIMPGGQLGVTAESWTASLQMEIAGTEL